MKIEVCANSYESAMNAQKAGADRIELCSELAVGGITPSHGLIIKVLEELSIYVNVLIRPRSGDFTFSKAEFEVMKKDIQFCKDLDCNGIVSGVLNDDGTVDIKRTKELIDLAKPLSFTFHRAFDWVKSPLTEIEKLIEIGVDRVLTSGQETTAIKGIHLLTKLQNEANNKLVILPGGGINSSNALEFKKAGFKEIHFSATKLHKTIAVPHVKMNSSHFFDETKLAISDVSTISSIIDLVK
jgi:copper homeostasis protein